MIMTWMPLDLQTCHPHNMNPVTADPGNCDQAQAVRTPRTNIPDGACCAEALPSYTKTTMEVVLSSDENSREIIV